MSEQHTSDGHVHESHGHKITTSSERGHQREEEEEEHEERDAERKGCRFVFTVCVGCSYR